MPCISYHVLYESGPMGEREDIYVSVSTVGCISDCIRTGRWGAPWL
jgi:hypothetical protein